MKKYSLIVWIFFALVLSAQAQKLTESNEGNLKSIDSVNVNGIDFNTMFPENDSKTFITADQKDQIAFSLKRGKSGVFRYRIELLRKWKGLPYDYGELQLKRIESDGAYVFEGGNSDCTLVLRMYGAQ